MSAALIPVLLLAVPVAPSTVLSPPSRSSVLFDNVAIPALQVAAAEAVMIVSWRIIDETQSNALATAVLLSAAPAVTLSTCGIGLASRYHRGHCWYAVLGGALGAASGLVVWGLFEAAPSLNPLKKGSDDTQAFVNGIAAALYVGAIGFPLGTVIGWNAGKDLADDQAAGAMPRPQATTPNETRASSASLPAPRPELVIPAPPPSHAGTAGPPAIVFPLLAGSF